MRFDGVIFDLDGVLCRTDRYHLAAWDELASGLGLELPPDIAERTRGIGRMESLELVLGALAAQLTPDEKEGLCEQKNLIYREQLKHLSREDIEPGAVEALTALRGRGVKLAVASSSRNAPLITERLGFNELLDAVVDGGMISRSKPDPEVFLKAAELLDCEPARCAVVEDAQSGIDAARSGGFFAVAYTCPSRLLEGCDAEIRNLADLPSLLECGVAAESSPQHID